MPLTSGHFKLPLILSTVNEKILSKDGTSTDNDCYYIFIHHLTFAGKSPSNLKRDNFLASSVAVMRETDEENQAERI